MAEAAQPKWEGKATAKVPGKTPGQVWPLLQDFCSLNKYLPSVGTCYQVDGVYGQPGMIRYCASTIPSSSSGDDEKIIKWCHEKLLAVDPLNRCFTYEIVENNMGFMSYMATIKVLQINSDGGGDEQGCLIEWSFLSDPIPGWTSDGLLTYVDSSVHIIAENIGKALKSE